MMSDKKGEEVLNLPKMEWKKGNVFTFGQEPGKEWFGIAISDVKAIVYKGAITKEDIPADAIPLRIIEGFDDSMGERTKGMLRGIAAMLEVELP